MNPDYTKQLERLISVLSHQDPVPAWVISIVSVVIGAGFTVMLGSWKEHHDAKRRIKKLERAMCGELVVNHCSLLGMIATHYDFTRMKPTQKPFGGMFTLDVLEGAKAHGDVLYDVPKFAAMRTLYMMYQGMLELNGGGPSTEALAHDSINAFEMLFVQGDLNQQLIIELCETCSPNWQVRLVALSNHEIKPGQ